MIPRRRECGASRYPLSSHFFTNRERKRCLAFARNDDTGMRYSRISLLPLKGGGRSAGDWLCSLSPSANPLPFGHPPFRRKGVDRFLPLFSPSSGRGRWLSPLLPPSSGRRCPEGAEVGSRYRLKKNVRYAFPRFVIPSPAEGSFSFPFSFIMLST